MHTLLKSPRSHRNRRPAIAVAAGTLALCLAASFATFAPAQAQDAAATAATATLNGDWTGALEVQGVQLHLVLHVKTDGGATTATLDSPDQGAADMPVSRINRTGSKITFALDSIDGHYAGDIAPGDASIAGTWSQGGMELPLTFTRK